MAASALRTLTVNLLVTVVSILVTLVIAEIGLRTIYPKYEYAAEAQFQPDSLRITTRPANTRRTVRHPDNGTEHLVIYNNHGMRQHRDVEVTDLQGAVVYLASEASDFMTGHDMVIDGGYCAW